MVGPRRQNAAGRPLMSAPPRQRLQVPTVLLGLALFTIATTLDAQTIRATLTGTVTDPAGAAVPGVAVTATNTATNITSTARTNDAGVYTFTALAPGEYVVAVEQSGFKRFAQNGVVLQIAQATRLDIRLELGA